MFPNPVIDAAHINVELSRACRVNIGVTDMTGRSLSGIEKGMLPSGARQISIDCSGLSRGVYCMTITIDGQSYTRKLIRR